MNDNVIQIPVDHESTIVPFKVQPELGIEYPDINFAAINAIAHQTASRLIDIIEKAEDDNRLEEHPGFITQMILSSLLLRCEVEIARDAIGEFNKGVADYFNDHNEAEARERAIKKIQAGMRYDHGFQTDQEFVEDLREKLQILSNAEYAVMELIGHE